MLMVDVGIVAAVFFVLYLLIAAPMRRRAKQQSAPEPETAGSLRQKIAELERKRAERVRLAREVEVSRELADVDAELEELRKQLAEAETRENAAGSR